MKIKKPGDDGIITIAKKLVPASCINTVLDLLYERTTPTIIPSKGPRRGDFRVYAQGDRHNHDERRDRKDSSDCHDEIRRVNEV